MLKLEDDLTFPDSKRVIDATGGFVGSIHRTSSGEWKNTHVVTGQRLRLLPEGPFKTLDLAFDAFKSAVGSD